MSSSQLFSINANKNDKKRDKLRADRFKTEVQKVVSTSELVLIKRLREKNPRQEHKDLDAEDYDVWGAPSVKAPLFAKFETFRTSAAVKVKNVMAPLPGQSFNPTANAHKGVLNKVYIEEKTEIEKEKALSLKNQCKPTVVDEDDEPMGDDQQDYDSVSNSEDENGIFSFKAPDRLKKKTKKDLKRKVSFI
jgi:hypothetical protein